jgi:hypothetical protein
MIVSAHRGSRVLRVIRIVNVIFHFLCASFPQSCPNEVYEIEHGRAGYIDLLLYCLSPVGVQTTV